MKQLQLLSRIYTFLILLTLPGPFGHVLGQQGSWNPPNARLDYPRIILQPEDLQRIQSALSDSINQAVYDGIYRTARQNPSGNDNYSQHRLRAKVAQNAAFVATINRKRSGGNWVILSEDERNEFINKAIQLLETTQTDVSRSYTDWQYQSKALINSLCAYDLLMGLDIPNDRLGPARDRLIEFTTNFHRAQRFTFLFVRNNHTLMTAGALGLAAVVLNDHDSQDNNAQPAQWFATGLGLMDAVLWTDENNRQARRDVFTGYGEGPYYMKYGFLNLLPFFQGLKHFVPETDFEFEFQNETRVVPHPAWDPAYDSLYSWQARIRLPDGNLPPIEDSYVNNAFLQLAMLGKTEYHWPYARNNTSRAAWYNSVLDDVLDLRAHFLAGRPALDTAPEFTRFQVLPEAGNLVFRSSWDPDAIYMHVSAEHGLARSAGGGHNQADVGSFLLHAFGETMMLDPGYIKYDRRDEVYEAEDHNMVLAGNCGPQAGTPLGGAGDADGFIEQPFSDPKLDFARVRTAYCEMDLNRQFTFVQDRYFVVNDRFTSENVQQFTTLLHGHGLLDSEDPNLGSFTRDNNYFRWERNGTGLLAVVTSDAPDLRFETETRIHENRYDRIDEHTCVLAGLETSNEGHFLTLLWPYQLESGRPEVITHQVDQGSALEVASTSSSDFWIGASTSEPEASIWIPDTRMLDTLEFDGTQAGLTISASGQLEYVFLAEGQRLKYGNQLEVEADMTSTWSVQLQADSVMTLQVAEPVKLFIRTPHPLRALTSNREVTTSWDCSQQMLTVETAGSDRIILQFDRAYQPPLAQYSWTPEPESLQVNLQNESTGMAQQFRWTMDDSEFSGQTDPVYQADSAGEYVICLLAEDTVTGCTDTYCDTVRISGPSQVDSGYSELNQTISLYPNPFDDEIKVKIPRRLKDRYAALEIFTQDGRLICRETVSLDMEIIEAVLINLPSGSYVGVIRLISGLDSIPHSNMGPYRFRFVKQ